MYAAFNCAIPSFNNASAMNATFHEAIASFIIIPAILLLHNNLWKPNFMMPSIY
jgi:hypothetical protein